MKYLRLLFLLVMYYSCNSSAPTPEDKKSIEIHTVVVDKDTNNLSSQPPPVPIQLGYDTTQWTELSRLIPDILLDLRYATDQNFMEEQVYECGRCFLRPAVAQALAEAQQLLKKQNLQLLMYDCYRPRPVQWKLWNKVPNPKYVADPRKGSMHNRGAAVDLTIADASGQALDMGTDYDYFGREGWTWYDKLPDTVLANRKILRTTMSAVGLSAIKTEWWHFSYRKKKYKISDFVWKCNEAETE